MANEMHVIWFEYSDHSGAGVMRIYADEQRANEDLDLLSIVNDGKTYHLETLPVYGYAAAATLKERER